MLEIQIKVTEKYFFLKICGFKPLFFDIRISLISRFCWVATRNFYKEYGSFSYFLMY